MWRTVIIGISGMQTWRASSPPILGRDGLRSCLAGLGTLNIASRPARQSLGEVGRDALIIGRRFSAGYRRFQIGPVPEGRGEPSGLEMIRITSLAEKKQPASRFFVPNIAYAASPRPSGTGSSFFVFNTGAEAPATGAEAPAYYQSASPRRPI